MNESKAPYSYRQETGGEIVDYVALTDDRRIAYTRRGHGEHTILDFHGNPGSRLNPLPARHLSLLNVNVITFDRPGYGKSTSQMGRQIIDTAHDVEQLLDALRVERFGLIARSGGVPHALGTAALLGDRATGMFCASGLSPREVNPQWDDMSEDNQRKHNLARENHAALAFQMDEHATNVNRYKAALYETIAGDFEAADRKLLAYDAIFRPGIINSHAEGLSETASGWINDTLAINREDGWGFDCAEVQCPTVFWHGMQDPFSHYTHSERLRDLVPGSASVVHSTLGHFGSLIQSPNYLAYVRDCAIRQERDGQPSQLTTEELEQLFAVRYMHQEPILPKVVLHAERAAE